MTDQLTVIMQDTENVLDAARTLATDVRAFMGDDPPPPPPVATAAPFGPYYARLDEGHLASDIVRARVPIALLNIGENEGVGGIVARQALEALPNVQIIIRNTRKFRVNGVGDEVELEHQWKHGAQGAIDWWNYMRGVANAWGLTDAQKQRVYFMAINEWDGTDPAPPPGQRAGVLGQFQAFEIQRMTLLQQEGWKACILNFSEGCPEPDELDYVKNAIVNAGLYGHIVGVHSYFEEHDGAHGYTDEWYVRRYLKIRAKCAEWGVPCPQLVLTELALTSALNDGVGYRGMGLTVQQMMAHVKRTQAALVADGVLALLFAHSPYQQFTTYDYGEDRDETYDVLAEWNNAN